MIVTIHQPEHLPWLGFFCKMAQSDLFVVLDTVQYEKNYFQNRNRIRSNSAATGLTWITVPVLTRGRSHQSIKEVRIDNNNRRWGEKVWQSIRHNYVRAPYFEHYADFIRETYTNGAWDLLVDLNLHIIRHLKDELGIATPLVQASELKAKGSQTELLLAICQELGATRYLSGPGGGGST